jgi:hypothetical protein
VEHKVVELCVIEQKPPCAADWKASNLIVDFDLLANHPPNQLEEMLDDIQI